MSIEVSQLAPEVVEMLRQLVLAMGGGGMAAGAGAAAIEVAKKVRDHLVPKVADKVWERFTKNPERKEALADEVEDVLRADDALAAQVAGLVEEYRATGGFQSPSSIVSNSRNVQVAQGSGNRQSMSVGSRDRESEDDEAEDD